MRPDIKKLITQMRYDRIKNRRKKQTLSFDDALSTLGTYKKVSENSQVKATCRS